MPLDPAVERLLDALGQHVRPPWSELSTAQFRSDTEVLARLAGSGPTMDHVRSLTVEGGDEPLRARLYRPLRCETVPPVLVWFHGGGFCVGSLDSHDAACRQLADRSRAVVVSVAYRLAPEHPFPAQYDDACAATRWVVDHADALEVDPGRVGVGGDSAGANLAATVALWARDAGVPLRLQLLVYPGVDGTESFPSYHEHRDGYLLTQDAITWFKSRHTPARLGVHPRDPRYSPLHAASHAGVAPAYVLVMQYDPLHDEGQAYAELLEAAGVPVELRCFPGHVHGLFGMERLVPSVRAQVDDAAAGMRRWLAVAPEPTDP